MRAFLVGGQVIDLYSPTVQVNDPVGYRQKGVDSTRISIPMRDVRRVEARQANEHATGTLILVVGGVAGLFLLGAIAASSMGGMALALPRM